MNEITIQELIKIVQPGDVLMTSNPDGLGKYIIFSQKLAGDPAKYTHIAMFGRPTETASGLIYEANKTLDLHELKQYIRQDICVIRHKEMTYLKYRLGFFEIQNNIGQIYPYHRLIFHFCDSACNWILRKLNLKPRLRLAAWLSFGFAVCSEWIAEFYKKAGLLIFPNFKKTGGITPDHFDDARLKHTEIWETIYEGKLTDEAREKVKENNIQHNNQYKKLQTST